MNTTKINSSVNEKILRDKLYNKLKRYVLHKQRIIKNSRSDFYRTGTKVQSLDILLRYLDFMKDYKLHGVCKIIISKQDHLKNILPNMNNPSYPGSEKALQELIRLSHEYIT